MPRELAYVDADLREVPEGLRRNSNLLCELEVIDFECRSKPILSLQVSPGNQFICCSSQDGQISLIDATENPPRKVAMQKSERPITIVSFSPDALTIAVADIQAFVLIFDAHTLEQNFGQKVRSRWKGSKDLRECGLRGHEK